MKGTAAGQKRADRARRSRRLGWLAVLALLPACIDDTGSDAARSICGGGPGQNAGLWGPGADPAAAGRWLAVVGTDYQTTEVSVVDLEAMRAQASAFLHSGTRVTCVGTALSGDVVVGRTPMGDGSFVLIDRGTSVLTRVSPGGVQGQIAVGGGFFANPQDVIRLSNGTLVISRAQAAPEQGAAAGQGQDLLAVDEGDGTVRWRAPLAGQATLAGGHAWPGRMALLGGRIWVPLASVARDFGAMGPGRVVGVSADDGAIQVVVDAAQAKNCTAIRACGPDALAAVCSGFYKEGDLGRAAFSKVLGWNAEPSQAGSEAGQAQVLARADATEDKRGFGFDLAALDDDRGWIIADGDLNAGLPDALWEYDGAKQTLVRVLQASEPFSMTALHLDRARKRLWVTDRAAVGGDLVVLDVSGPAPARLLKRVESNPGGLRATEIAGF